MRELVVGDARAVGVHHGERAAAQRLEEERGRGRATAGAQGVDVGAAVEDVDRPALSPGPRPDPARAHLEVGVGHDRRAEPAGDVRDLPAGGVRRIVAQDGHGRIAAAVGCRGPQGAGERLEIAQPVRLWIEAGVGEERRHDLARVGRVGEAGRQAQVVLEHSEHAVSAAHDVGAGAPSHLPRSSTPRRSGS